MEKTNQQQPISCEKHDYLEIACLYNYEVEISLRDGRKLKAIAETTLTKPNKIEYLIVKIDDAVTELPMLELESLVVLTKPARFLRIDF